MPLTWVNTKMGYVMAMVKCPGLMVQLSSVIGSKVMLKDRVRFNTHMVTNMLESGTLINSMVTGSTSQPRE